MQSTVHANTTFFCCSCSCAISLLTVFLKYGFAHKATHTIHCIDVWPILLAQSQQKYPDGISNKLQLQYALSSVQWANASPFLKISHGKRMALC
jgi:hypothetical protein